MPGPFSCLKFASEMSAPSATSRQTLATRLRSGPLSVREATQISRALLSALETAHARGVAHGSITPSTIILEEGRASLEVASARTADVAADLYAVATVLYESVSGRPWVPGTDPERADWAGVPRRLRRALERALSRSAARRWPDAAAFQRALWVPRRRDTIWPAVLVILLAAAIISTFALCKPLGLCWERPQAAPTRSP